MKNKYHLILFFCISIYSLISASEPIIHKLDPREYNIRNNYTSSCTSQESETVNNGLLSTFVFSGWVDNDWMNHLNWDGPSGLLPGPGDEVQINAPCRLPSGENLTIGRLVNNYILGSFFLEAGATLTVDPGSSSGTAYESLAPDTINGMLNINNGYTGANLQNSVITGTLNTSGTMVYGIYVSGPGVKVNGTMDLGTASNTVIYVENSGIMNISGNIQFPPSLTGMAIENNGNITNNGTLHIPPTTATQSWYEKGTFTNNECAYIELAGRLNMNFSNAFIYNHGIINSSYFGTSSHYYSYINNDGIVVDQQGKMFSSFSVNTGVKTKQIQYSNCQFSPGYLSNVTDGTLTNISIGEFYLDTTLTALCGNYDQVMDTVGLEDNTVGVKKFFVEITDTDGGCSIIVPVTVSQFTNINAYYSDKDMDGYGDNNDLEASCYNMPNRTTNGGDCNDEDDTINPNAPEVCDGLDNDCDGSADPGSPQSITLINSNADWHTPGHWNLNIVPGSCSDVEIPGGKIVTSSPNTTSIAHTLHIQSGGKATLDGDIIIDPSFSPSYAILNEGILTMNQNSSMTITHADTSIVNKDSIDVSLADLYIYGTSGNVGIKNHVGARAQFGSYYMEQLDHGLINDGIMWLGSDNPLLQAYQNYSIISNSVIYNTGWLHHRCQYFGSYDLELTDYIWENYGSFIFGFDSNSYAEFPAGNYGILNGGTLETRGTLILNGRSFDTETGSKTIIRSGAQVVIK